MSWIERIEILLPCCRGSGGYIFYCITIVSYRNFVGVQVCGVVMMKESVLLRLWQWITTEAQMCRCRFLGSEDLESE